MCCCCKKLLVLWEFFFSVAFWPGLLCVAKAECGICVITVIFTTLLYHIQVSGTQEGTKK